MKIRHVETRAESVELTRPYTIARCRISAVELFFVSIVDEGGLIGLGAASPSEDVTGETHAACAEALRPAHLEWLVGRNTGHIGALCREVASRLPNTPAARAALDMALYDLFAKQLGVPLVDLLGRCHERLPTSITIGIMSTEEALAEADEYLERGFRCLKIKLGHSWDEDVERLHKLRERVGAGIQIRVDANQGYSSEETLRFGRVVEQLELEFVEQPMPVSANDEVRALPDALRRRLAADESMHGEADALALTAPPAAYGILNIKLMKCGGITPALGIARIAEFADAELMWGCMDESAIGIAAALHAAYASPATRYLDLDGSFDLARDPAEGGFVLDKGDLLLTDAPGLGVRLCT